MSDVYIACVGMTKFGRHLDRSDKDLAREAVEAALREAGVDMGDVGQAFFASCVIGSPG